MQFPVFQFVPIVSCPVTRNPSEVSSFVFFTPSHQIFVHTEKIPLEPSLLQAEQPQLSQPPLVWLKLQILNHLQSPPLDSIQYSHLSFVLESPELDTTLQVCLTRAQ